MSVKLREHQKEAVEKLDNGRILAGDVGSGKTITSIAYFFTKVCGGTLNDWGSVKTPKKLYVITTAKVRDSLAWEKTAAAFSISKYEDATIPGVTITVDSWNNIGKYTEVEDAFFIFDEQRLVGSGTWVKSFLKIAKSNEWILLSATPGDTWFDYLPVFIANGFFKNKTEFSREHVVWQPYTKFPKVLRYTGVNRLAKYKNQILVEMPFERHTTREIVDFMVEYDTELFNKVVKERWHPYEERPIRDVAELFHAMRKVVNSDASRAEAVRKLWRKHPKLIVFYNFDYELEELRKLANNPPTPLTSVGDLSASIGTSPQQTTSEEKSLENGPHPETHKISDSTVRTSSTSGVSSDQSSAKLNPSEFHTSSSISTVETFTADAEANEWESNSKAKSGTDNATSTVKSSSQQSSTKLSSVKSSPSTSASEPPAALPATTPCVEKENFAVAEWNGHKHEPIPETDQWLYLVQYQAGAEGWNCVETDAMVFYSLTYSYKNFMQAQGRIDRLNTPFQRLKYYVLMSTSVIDRAVRRSLNEKKDFNERRFYPKYEKKEAA